MPGNRAVIAREISNAFDNNGALFDEYGNSDNWWTGRRSCQFPKQSTSNASKNSMVSLC
ncbi:hypothetical protein I8F73_00665 [Enterococcus faecalis]|nr:hypothetical protein [Enterococcus faecalis]